MTHLSPYISLGKRVSLSVFLSHHHHHKYNIVLGSERVVGHHTHHHHDHRHQTSIYEMTSDGHGFN